MLNRVCIVGRLTAIPEYRLTAAQIPVASFGLAVERDYKNRETGERQTDFFDVTAWRGLADFITKYFNKGDKVIVDGRLEKNTWTDGDGYKRKKVVIVAENIYFAQSKTGEKPPVELPGEPDSGEAEDFSNDLSWEGSEQ